MSNYEIAQSYLNGNKGINSEVIKQLQKGTKKQVIVRVLDVYEKIRAISPIEATGFSAHVRNLLD